MVPSCCPPQPSIISYSFPEDKIREAPAAQGLSLYRRAQRRQGGSASQQSDKTYKWNPRGRDKNWQTWTMRLYCERNNTLTPLQYLYLFRREPAYMKPRTAKKLTKMLMFRALGGEIIGRWPASVPCVYRRSTSSHPPEHGLRFTKKTCWPWVLPPIRHTLCMKYSW